MISISIFNNKGGVGKTTLLCNIAAYLKTHKRKKVIIIDADPQSNATIYLLPFDDIYELYKKPNSEKTINDLFKEYRKTSTYFSKDLPIHSSPRFMVDIIPGDPNISTYEDFLSKDWFEGINGEPRGLNTTMIFKDLLIKLEAMGYDYAFFDVGPSLGAINRSVLLACDYFILPMSSDIFSLKAIENIELTVKSWQKSFKIGLDKYSESEMEQYTIRGNPISPHLKFLGYVTQQYTAKSVNGEKRAVKAFDKIIKEIPVNIAKHLVPINGTTEPIEYNLGEIQTLHSLIPLSQTANSPLFSLKADDGVVGAHFSKVKEFLTTITNIVNKIDVNLSILEQ
ncbi:cellulose biosynthesis protein BcsQ [Mucilaginibacter sp. SG538B]|uniref:ParA family protein n=1 Tax=Mucilaginibacter sp. SG538B TaxID=2587021 RepID=UPI00159E668E|nr:AAA family ATPase [Mucilaginibacter sp. SG538B]NVM64492.1 cellulose biosynthesis protein BcsQ [Mucilaginibacter sp. SG538B]